MEILLEPQYEQKKSTSDLSSRLAENVFKLRFIPCLYVKWEKKTNE